MRKDNLVATYNVYLLLQLPITEELVFAGTCRTMSIIVFFFFFTVGRGRFSHQ